MYLFIYRQKEQKLYIDKLTQMQFKIIYLSTLISVLPRVKTDKSIFDTQGIGSLQLSTFLNPSQKFRIPISGLIDKTLNKYQQKSFCPA